MLPANHTDRPHIAFDDHRFIVYALDLPQTRPRLSWPRCHSRPLEHRQQDDDLLIPELGDGGCINDTALLRAGGNRILGFTATARSIVGAFSRCTEWGAKAADSIPMGTSAP